MDNNKENKKNSGLRQAHPAEEIPKQEWPMRQLPDVPIEEAQQTEPLPDTSNTNTAKKEDQGPEWPTVSWP